MRTLLAFIFALLAMPALAQSWEPYENGRYGFTVSVPPGFVGQGESDNGDGQAFTMDGRAVELRVWGGNMLEPDLEAEAGAAIAFAQDDAWNITGQTTTPRWATFSAIKGFRLLHTHLVALCEPGTYAALRLEYSVTDAGTLDPLLGRLDKSLRPGDC